MKPVRGLRNFRSDLLMTAERLITLTCGSENSQVGPLTERSHNLLLKLSAINNISCSNSSNIVFLVEDNFYYRSMRYDWFQVAKRSKLKKKKTSCEIILIMFKYMKLLLRVLGT